MNLHNLPFLELSELVVDEDGLLASPAVLLNVANPDTNEVETYTLEISEVTTGDVECKAAVLALQDKWSRIAESLNCKLILGRSIEDLLEEE